MNIADEIKNTYKRGGTLTKLIFVNVAVFFVVHIIDIIVNLFMTSPYGAFSIVNWLAVPSGLIQLLYRPWTLFTYMILHYDLFHILFNMLWLFWFGKLFVTFIGDAKLLAVYVMGGLSGALLYIISFNLIPAFIDVVDFSQALGASASVVAVVVAISFYKPDYQMNLLFLGPVKLKYIALASIALDILMVFESSNAGGHIAHLGGAIFGYFYIRDYKNGKDISIGFNRIVTKIVSWFQPNQKMKVTYRRTSVPKSDLDYNKKKKEEQKKLDEILDKISKNGYESLTKSEKEFLFKAGKK